MPGFEWPDEIGDDTDEEPDHEPGDVMLEVAFDGEVWEWRGPAPFYFVTVPEDPAAAIGALAGIVTYGWGMIPVGVRIGGTAWETSLWPKDGRYVVPIKDLVRRGERIARGDVVTVRLTIRQ